MSYTKVQKLLGPWTLEGAIRERAEKEAEVMWALKESEPHKDIPPMPSQRWRPAPIKAFISMILP